MALRALSLCSGIGGLDLGVASASDTNTLCYVEGEAYAAATLVARMEEGRLDSAPIWSDLRTFDAHRWRGLVDTVLAGYPCQPFSVAGLGRGVDDPRHLWPHVLRVLRQVQAPFLFVENVRGHVSRGLREVLEDLARLGFNAEWDIFSAEEEGAPHRRERLFLFAYADGGYLRDNGSESYVADSAGAGLAQRRGSAEPEHAKSKLCCPVADADGQRQLQQGGAQPTLRGRPLDSRQQGDAWCLEPDVGRVAHGVANRVDRLRALGNAVVPACAARAWLELTERAMS